jgi:hypothetical protein
MKYIIDIKEHKVSFVLGLLENMSFVEIEAVEEDKKEEEKE